MNVTFGGPVNTSLASNVPVSDARIGVAVPVASENVDSTSFTPVNSAQESAKAMQESSEQGVEKRLASEQARAEGKTESKSQREQQDQQQADRRQQRDTNESQADQQVADRRQQDAQEQQQLEVELKQIQQLADRDREVRAHEQAHQSVGGQHAGAMSFSYERGPDGQNYAVAGEVSIDTSDIPGNPQATLDKAETIRRAALAPAEPSNQDRQVASQAVLMSVEARADIQQMQNDELTEKAQEEENSDVAEDSGNERLEADKKAQDEQQEEDVDESNLGADIQVLNERLSRIHAQILEISQIDDKASSKVNLLDVAT